MVKVVGFQAQRRGIPLLLTNIVEYPSTPLTNVCRRNLNLAVSKSVQMTVLWKRFKRQKRLKYKLQPRQLNMTALSHHALMPAHVIHTLEAIEIYCFVHLLNLLVGLELSYIVAFTILYTLIIKPFILQATMQKQTNLSKFTLVNIDYLSLAWLDSCNH